MLKHVYGALHLEVRPFAETNDLIDLMPLQCTRTTNAQYEYLP